MANIFILVMFKYSHRYSLFFPSFLSLRQKLQCYFMQSDKSVFVTQGLGLVQPKCSYTNASLLAFNMLTHFIRNVYRRTLFSLCSCIQVIRGFHLHLPYVCETFHLLFALLTLFPSVNIISTLLNHLNSKLSKYFTRDCITSQLGYF